MKSTSSKISLAFWLVFSAAHAETFHRLGQGASEFVIATCEGVTFGRDAIAFGPGARFAQPETSNSDRRLIYREVWRGIDVEFYFHRHRLEYDVVANPGADLSLASFSFPGTDRLAIMNSGALRVAGSGRTAVFSKPEAVSAELPVASHYTRPAPDRIGFQAEWDGRHTLRIDPTLVLSTANGLSTQDHQGWNWSTGYTNPTYQGGSGAVLVTSSGDMLFAGQTAGSNLRYPVILGNDTNPYFPKAFIALRSASASIGAVFGLSSNITALAEDPAGGYLVAGATYGPLPATPGLFRSTIAGSADGFLMHMPRDLSKADWITYLDGGFPSAMALDSRGNIFLTGAANAGRPYVTGSYLTPHPGGSDIFILKLSPGANTAIFSAIVGGSADESGVALAVAADGSVLVGGTTSSPDLGIPAGAMQAAISTDNIFHYQHGFVVRLSPDGSRLTGGTYAGGTQFDEVRSVAPMANGDVLISGITSSADFPATSHLFGDIATVPGYLFSGFMVRLNSAMSGAVFSETLAGAPLLEAHLPPDDVFLFAISPNNLPKTPDALLGPAAHVNSFGSTLLELDPGDGHLIYSGGLGRSYLGNYSGTTVPMIAVGRGGLVGLAGLSVDDSFPLIQPAEPLQGPSGYAATFLQEFRFGDASPAQNSVSVYGLSASSSPVMGSVGFPPPRRPVMITPVQSGGWDVLSIQPDRISPPGGLIWTASPSATQLGLSRAVVQYTPAGGTVQQNFSEFLIFTDALAAASSSVQVSGTAGGGSVPVTIQVSAQAGLPFSISADQPWIQPVVTGAVSPAAIAFALQTQGLAPGTWTGNIQLSPNGLQQDTLTIPVQLTLK